MVKNPKDKDKSKEEGRGKGKGRDAANKVAQLERKVDELIGKGRSAPRPQPRSKKLSPSWPWQYSRQAEGRPPSPPATTPHAPHYLWLARGDP